MSPVLLVPFKVVLKKGNELFDENWWHQFFFLGKAKRNCPRFVGFLFINIESLYVQFNLWSQFFHHNMELIFYLLFRLFSPKCWGLWLFNVPSLSVSSTIPKFFTFERSITVMTCHYRLSIRIWAHSLFWLKKRGLLILVLSL